LDTTAREDSYLEGSTASLALEWVWPVRRLERLQGSHISIGRDDGAVIKLDRAGVSRKHAELYRQGPLYVIRDLGSTNGTWLGGRRIEHAPISPGSVLRVGDWVGVFVMRGDEPVEFGELAPGVFGGAEMAQTLAPARRAATSNVPILLIGDTGVGKDRVARAIHHFSARRGPFFAINCAALPDQLAEAELFGYRRGAFTGADRANGGYFRAAHGGTLFLDEMPELSPAMQAKVLRVIEDGLVLGLGESTPVQVDVRIVSASQAPLTDLVARKLLRQDLAARLSGLELRLPALRSRRSDVALLFAQFLKQQSGGRPPKVEPRLVEALCLHAWPQNVRELELLTRTLLAVHGHEPVLRRQHLPGPIAALCEEREAETRQASEPRERREYDISRLEQELQKNGGNVQAAARALGISRQRIYRLLDYQSANGSNQPGGVDGGSH
jgi:DNA-binding NtrC family response regulator